MNLEPKRSEDAMSNERCVEYSGFGGASITIYWRKCGFIGRFEDFLCRRHFSGFARPNNYSPPVVGGWRAV
jgi:hypothetical protein